ncbi:FAD binding domain of DNA photolyase-domain-containing protein [Clohesyomyces aquaticus]|uniref:Cryptochrome DASH n=1 Tax=Clohesyomyces aquaticus TaxID=1231657 RepID=A0A1Y1YQX0_9PLEO|nr:FAD binding domain of DNA photolyase-domain-containing protein [Clohesyomyces aquaticus]
MEHASQEWLAGKHQCENTLGDLVTSAAERLDARSDSLSPAPSSQVPRPRILIYILRRDLRLSDNPLFHQASLLTAKDSSTPKIHNREDSIISALDTPFATHFLPVYVFPAHQVEVSGFLASPEQRSPYPEAKSAVAGVWRTGPHRARFMAEGVWDLKESLEKCDSGLEIRVGMIGEVVQNMLKWYSEGDGDGNGKRADVAGIWMTNEEGAEEKSDEAHVRDVAQQHGVEFKLWDDEKYYIDDRDLPLDHISDLPNVYTTFRKSLEPLISRPRRTVPTPSKLLPLPPDIPPQSQPFKVPTSLTQLEEFLLAPLNNDAGFGLPHPPQWPPNANSAHPFLGGETAGLERLSELINNGIMTRYKATRNGMLGRDFSTKLSAYLAQGMLTARQVHWAMHEFEEGRGPGRETEGYGKGEGDGTYGVRFELLWRDYMRLCVRKFGARMFHPNGIRDYLGIQSKVALVSQADPHEGNTWTKKANVGTAGDLQQAHDKPNSSVSPYSKPASTTETNKMTDSNGAFEIPYRDARRPQPKIFKLLDRCGISGDDPVKTREAFTRWRSGRTGMGLIDASNRELFLTGYTSNRARQNIASYLTSRLGIDWRAGAEWYEFLLTDYDVGNNWGNWQYVAGVGNDPREGRIFNPVKQALDYDPQAEYIRTWVPELRGVRLTKSLEPGEGPGGAKGPGVDRQKLLGVYQPWKLSAWEKEDLGLTALEWVDSPLIKIDFKVGSSRPQGNGAKKNGQGKGQNNEKKRNKGNGAKGRGGRGNWGANGRDSRRQGMEEKVWRNPIQAGEDY